MKPVARFILRNAPVAILGALLGRAGVLPLEHAEWWFWMVPFALVMTLRDAAEASK